MADQLIAILLSVLIILGLIMAFTVGSNDETSSALVGSGIVRLKIALIIGGISLAIGMILFGQRVGKTVGGDLLGPGMKYTTFMLFAVLIGAIIWLIIGSFNGIPLSTTHCFVGGIFGVIIVYSFVIGEINPSTALDYDVLFNIVLGWILAPIFGLLVTFIIYRIVTKVHLKRQKGLSQIERSEKIFAIMLIAAVIFSELWVGGNNSAVIGMLYGLYCNESITYPEFFFLIFICALFVFLGMIFVGKYVIKNLASQMTDARPCDGFIVLISQGLIMMTATLLALPISHSHVLVFCILGLSVAQKKQIDVKAFSKMTSFWILTFPISAFLAGFIYFGFFSFGYW